MDEEAVRLDFEVWAATNNYCLRWIANIEMYDYADTQSAFEAWLAATRRADREAREECAVAAWNHHMDTCKRIGVSPTDNEHWNATRDIRATIKEDKWNMTSG